MAASAIAGDELLLDDFQRDDGASALGTRWQGFTDRVMGGRSDMQAGRVRSAGRSVLRMNGEVRLDNNGGFIQVRLPLGDAGATLDGSAYDGVRIIVRGIPGAYFLHLRTPDCRRPWQYYRAAIDVTAEWREMMVPFSAFEGEAIDGAPDVSRLQSIALVAYGEAFSAEIELARIALAGRH